MKDFEVIGVIGDRQMVVKICFAQGAAGVIQLIVDNYYHGIVHKVGDEWRVYLDPKSSLCSNDILILFDLIDEKLNQI